MTSAVEPPYAALKRFLAALDEHLRYAVVKNPDVWESLRRGGDWDLVVDDVAAAQRLMTEHLGVPNRVSARAYVAGHFYPWGSIDLLPSLEWRGIELIDPDRVFDAARVETGGWRVAAAAHQAIMSWIGPLLASGTYKARYAAVVQEAVVSDREELDRLLTRIFGQAAGRWLSRLAAEGRPTTATASVDQLRRNARATAAARAPLATALRMARFYLGELRVRLDPALPFVLIASPAERATLQAWHVERAAYVPGVAVVDGESTLVYDEAGEWMARPGLRTRVQLSKLQARGWLVTSTLPRGGIRGRSVLVARPRALTVCDLNAELARHAAQSVGGSR